MRKSIEKYGDVHIILLIFSSRLGTMNGKMATVRLIIREVAEAKGITTPFALSNETGLNYAICHRLWQGEQRRVDVSTLAAICSALKVKPGQLFEYTAD